MSLMVAGLLLLSACGQAQGSNPNDSPLPDGWSWYHDTRFPYQAPIPPGWQAVEFARGPVEGSECSSDVVDLVPPGTPTDDRVTGPAERVPEFISIVVNPCAEWAPSDNPNYQPLPDAPVVSGAAADFYGYGPDGYGIHRQAVTHFGGHQYLMVFAYEYQPEISPAERQQHDLDWYMQVLKGFKYTGK
jgi:hypothetical protein